MMRAVRSNIVSTDFSFEILKYLRIPVESICPECQGSVSITSLHSMQDSYLEPSVTGYTVAFTQSGETETRIEYLCSCCGRRECSVYVGSRKIQSTIYHNRPRVSSRFMSGVMKTFSNLNIDKRQGQGRCKWE